MIMADVTARILVGGRYMLHLLENDRAGWDCVDLSYNSERKPRTTLGCNSYETILKDGLLMIAIHCLADEEIIKRAKSMSKEIMNNFVNVGSLTDEQLSELHAMNRKHSDGCYNCGSDSATRKLMYLDITLSESGSSIGGPETQKELKQHHISASISYSEFVKGTERIRYL